MLAKDFKPDRMDAAKEVAKEFVSSRPFDRFGLVVFSGESFTQCPLTSDHRVVKNLFSEIKVGLVGGGTAIGNGLANAVSRLKESKSKSKVVILLTDGENNDGSIAPITAAEIAKTFDIRVYTIGVGSKGKALSPTGIYPDGRYSYGYTDVNIDEKSLKEIASLTGGRYFRATDNNSLRYVYSEIDKMEKTRFEEKNYTNKSEHFLPFALIATALLLLESVLKNTYFRTAP